MSVSQIDDKSKVDTRSIFNFLQRTLQSQPTGWVFFAISEGDGERWRELPIQTRVGDESDRQHLRAIIHKYADCRNFYFCPTTFSVDRRRKQYALPTHLLHCDVDGGNLNDFEQRPSLVWQTSPGRHQAIWMMDRRLKCDDAEACNRALAQHSEDGTGWDVCKYLRVPYTFNFKPEYDRPKVILRKADFEPLYGWKPERIERKADTGERVIDFDTARSLDPRELKRKFVRIAMTFAAPPMDGDRSATWMWQAGLMRDAGASDEEIAAMLTLCRKTFADRFPRGFDDKRARAEMERLCAKLEKKK